MPDCVFEHHLEVALKSLDINAVINNLEKIYQKSKKNKKANKDLAVEFDLFFGPSKIFGQIFKLAMLKTFQHKDEEKAIIEEYKAKLDLKKIIPSENKVEENKMRGGSID